MKDKRQAEIMKLLLKEQTIPTEELRARFGVSMETIRRDVSALEQTGLIKKVYGGAVWRRGVGQPPCCRAGLRAADLPGR